MGPPSPEVTGAFCRVPSTPFSQSPGYALPVHQCRFRVRSMRRRCFLEVPGRPANPVRRNGFRPSSRSAGGGMLTPFPSATAVALALGARLTLRGLTLRRNPWTCGVRGSHSHLATHVSILASDTSSAPRGTPSPAYGTLRYRVQKTGIRDQGSELRRDRPCSMRAISWYSPRHRSAVSAPI
jgi:hypothetical protein